jgi:ribosome-binding protein aMBF1 (putative translation factor)
MKRTPIAEQLRKAIRAAEKRGTSRYRIAKLAGIRYSVMCRIAEGENLPVLNTAEKIAGALGLRLTLCLK